MRHGTRIFCVFFILFMFSGWKISLADDLDDGIPIDDSIAEYDQIGENIENNYSYLSLRAQSDAVARSSDMDNIPYMNEGSVLNSVILEAGSTVQGDIIIIDQSQGDRTIIAND